MAFQTEHVLLNFMERIQREMSENYKTIRMISGADPGTAGGQGEENWAELLRGWLPDKYTVETGGRIIGHDGHTSPQVDVIVLKDTYPKKWLGQKLYLAAGVAAAFECKSTLRANHVMQAVKGCISTKSLFPTRLGTPYKELHSPILYGLLAHSHNWKRPKSAPNDNLTRLLQKSDANHVQHPRQALDLVCVADLATWTSSIAKFPGPKQGQGSCADSADDHYNDGAVFSYYVQNAGITISPSDPFTPIGAFIAHLSRKLAWEDPGLRDFADYYRMVDLQGSGYGDGRKWSSSIFSHEVRSRMGAEQSQTAFGWDEWQNLFF